METVAGIVAAAGSPAGHMSTIAREFDVPCVVGAVDAIAMLQEGAIVTLDADAGIIYEGEVGELLRPVSRSAPLSSRRDPARENLQLLLQRVAPLTLTEPDASSFCPANCRTFHDIARYVHQKSMTEMFELNEPSGPERRVARRLIWRVPLEVLLLDVGGSISAQSDRNVPVDKLRSVPLLALIEGMTDPRLRWAGPVGFDLKGFMSVVVRSAADDQRYGEPNYCLCSKDYVHFATRLAYHFATVDAICGPAINENYARFLFFGGAAIAQRREWRAHFLATVLERNEFTVKRVSDRVEAMLAKRGAAQVEEALVMLGRLMVASRHLDMVIESKTCADALAHAFLAGDYAFERVSRCS
jgi:pyruvate,water dikinase